MDRGPRAAPISTLSISRVIRTILPMYEQTSGLAVTRPTALPGRRVSAPRLTPMPSPDAIVLVALTRAEDVQRMAQAAAALVEPQDAVLFLRRRVRDNQLEQEAVELRLRQAVGALVLDRVLRGHHREQVGERMADAVDGDGLLLHHFQQGRLRLGRRAVDLVGHEDVGEDGAGAELEAAGLQVEDVGAEDVARHQVGRELHALAIHAQQPGQGAGHERLGGAGHAFEQDVAAAQQGQQHQLQVLPLADDHTLGPVQQVIHQVRDGQVLLSAHASSPLERRRRSGTIRAVALHSLDPCARP